MSCGLDLGPVFGVLKKVVDPAASHLIFGRDSDTVLNVVDYVSGQLWRRRDHLGLVSGDLRFYVLRLLCPELDGCFGFVSQGGYAAADSREADIVDIGGDLDRTSGDLVSLERCFQVEPKLVSGVRSADGSPLSGPIGFSIVMPSATKWLCQVHAAMDLFLCFSFFVFQPWTVGGLGPGNLR